MQPISGSRSCSDCSLPLLESVPAHPAEKQHQLPGAAHAQDASVTRAAALQDGSSFCLVPVLLVVFLIYNSQTPGQAHSHLKLEINQKLCWCPSFCQQPKWAKNRGCGVGVPGSHGERCQAGISNRTLIHKYIKNCTARLL